MASVLCVPVDALPCFPEASEACLEDLEPKSPGLHGQQLRAVLGREESLGTPGPGQRWVCAITFLSYMEGMSSLHLNGQGH